jgi:hypothetical protein
VDATNPFLVVGGWRAIEGWTETDQIKGGPLCGLSRPTVGRLAIFRLHVSPGIIVNGAGHERAGQTQSNRVKPARWGVGVDSGQWSADSGQWLVARGVGEDCPVKPSQSWSNQIKPNQARKRFDPNEVNPKRCAYVRLKFDLPVAKEAGRKQPNQTQSNQIKPPAGGDGSGQWPVASASGWWRKRVGENCPVKPSQTQSNPVKPSQTSQTSQTSQIQSNPVKPVKPVKPVRPRFDRCNNPKAYLAFRAKRLKL